MDRSGGGIEGGVCDGAPAPAVATFAVGGAGGADRAPAVDAAPAIGVAPAPAILCGLPPEAAGGAGAVRAAGAGIEYAGSFCVLHAPRHAATKAATAYDFEWIRSVSIVAA